MIKIEGLNIQYKNHVVIEDANLHFSKGKLYILVGESGCGKSSVLQVIGLMNKCKYNLFKYKQCDIDLENENLIANIRRNEIGYVFQENNLFDDLTVKDNLEMIGKLSNTSIDGIELLNKVHLHVSLNQQVATLSGGERQRLAIACALAKSPSVLIADEPTSSLDHNNEMIIMALLQELAHQNDLCIIIASHSKNTYDYADHVIKIENKKISHLEDYECKGTISSKKLSPMFYAFYMKKGYLLYSKLSYFITILLAIGITIVSITNSLKTTLIDSNEENLNKLANNQIRLVGNSFDDSDIEYFSKLQYVESVDYYDLINHNGYFIAPCFDYQNLNLKDNEVLVSKKYASSRNLSLGDTIEIEHHVLYIKDVLNEPIDQFVDSKSEYIYVNSNLLNNKEHNSIVLKIQSYNKVKIVVDKLNSLNADYQIITDNRVEILDQSQQKFIQYINLVCIILIGILIIVGSYIEYLNYQKHQYEFALLKANGLTNKNIARIVIYKTLYYMTISYIVSFTVLICVRFLLSYKLIYLDVIKYIIMITVVVDSIGMVLFMNLLKRNSISILLKN